MKSMKLIVDTKKAQILFSSLLNTQIECRRIEEDADALAKYPTLVGMAQLTKDMVDDLLDTLLDPEEAEDETI
tara:strand:- start:229 stop:447 length:219 start_codon:yes stop_codon:yes gene_type:complete